MTSSSQTGVESLLQRDRAITIAALVALWALTWAWLAAGAGMGSIGAMPDMPDMPGMPGMTGMAPAAATWSLGEATIVVAMWWTMMVAMMTPSAAPTVLLYARVHRHAQSQGQLQAAHAPTSAFVAGYFLAWLMFSVLATVLQLALQRAGLVSMATMAVQGRLLAGSTLVMTGLYQLSPLKNACLSHCRSPAEFLSRHWRAGASGALRLGMLHGGYCVGCCWLLMALLFVGGVMNLAWIAALSLLVLAEKLVPGGRWIGRGAGLVLVAWGATILLR